MHRRSSFETKIRVAFAAAVLVVAGLTVATWKLANDATEAAGWVAHSHEVLRILTRASGDTLQIELSTQNFRISGDTARLTERDAAITAREETLRRLQQLIRDNPLQQERWEQLRAVVDERLAIARKTEQLRKTQGFEAASAYIAGAPLQETRERLHRLLHAMEDDELQLLQVRNAEQLHARQTLLAAGALVALLLVGLLSATYALIRRQLRETEASRQALVASERSLSTTLHSIGDGVLATDTLGRITRMNPVAERLTGWTLDQARGNPIEEVFCIINEHTRAPAVVPVAMALATGEVQELANHTTLVARDGHEYPIADSAAPIRDDAGRLKGVVLVFRDVTAERQTKTTIREQNAQLEQRVRERTLQLLESEDHLRSVINYVPALIAYVDADQRYVYVNHPYQTCFAPGQTDITGRTVQEILGDERYALASPLIARALQGVPRSYDWQPFPGIWHTVSYVPKRGAQGRVTGYYVLGHDITERKRAEEKIQALNAALEQHVRELEHVSRALKTLSAGNRTMLRATDEQELLDTMCRAIVTTGHYLMASVWYRVDDDYQSLRPMAECNHPGGLDTLRQMNGSWGDNARGQGAVATAIRTDQTRVVRNILTDPAYEPWRPYLPGCACGVACPLHVDGEIIGGIVIYAAEPDSFGPDEVTLLTESADDLAFGISTLRARVEKQKTQETLDRLSRYDALTGLPNEVQFTEALTAAIDASTRHQRPSTALQVNVERLNEINVALGFNQGDQILREFSTRLRHAAPETATVARLRG
ncbi:MAG: PAS domain-containing protein, partial [Rhodoferax sp.]